MQKPSPRTCEEQAARSPEEGCPGKERASPPPPPLLLRGPAALPPAHTWLWARNPRTARSRKQSPSPCECRRLPCPPPSTGPRKAAPTFRELATVRNANCQQGHTGRPWTPPRPTRTLTQAARSHCGEGVKERQPKAQQRPSRPTRYFLLASLGNKSVNSASAPRYTGRGRKRPEARQRPQTLPWEGPESKHFRFLRTNKHTEDVILVHNESKFPTFIDEIQNVTV